MNKGTNNMILGVIISGILVIALILVELFVTTTTCSDVMTSKVIDKRTHADYKVNDDNTIETKNVEYFITLEDGTEWEIEEAYYNVIRDEVSYVIVTDTSLILRFETQHIEISGDLFNMVQFRQIMPQGGMMPPGGFDPNMQQGGYGQMPQGGMQPPMGFDPNMQQPNMAQATPIPNNEDESSRIEMPIPSAREATEE